MKKKSTDQMALAGTEEGEILGRLQERVEKAITLIQALRRERDSWKSRAEAAEAQVAEQGNASEKLSSLEDERDQMRKERSEIRNRIESILSNLEALES